MGSARARGPAASSRRSSSSTRRSSPTCTPEGKHFDLYRVWGHGGKTNVWGRVSLRYGELDFKGRRRTAGRSRGRSPTADIAPYYDKVEQLIGVCGGDDDSDSLPGSKFLQPPPAPRCAERLLQKAAQGHRHPHRRRPPRQHDQADARLPGLPLLRQLRRWLRHRVVLQLGRSPAAVRAEDRQARDPLERRRRARARGRQGPRQGRPVLRPRRPGPSGRCSARSSSSARAAWTPRASCSTRSRTRIPTASATASRRHRPLPLRADPLPRRAASCRRCYGKAATRNDHGIGGEHVYMPRFNHRDGRKRDYLRGFGMQFWNTGASDDRRARRLAQRIPGFGVALKDEIKRALPGLVRDPPVRRGAALRPQPHHGRTTPATDRYGVPLAEDRLPIGDNERKMAEHMADTRRGDRQGRGRRAGRLQARRARPQRLGDPRARHLPHGRGPEASRR